MTKAPEAAQSALDVLLMDATDSTGSRFVRPGAAVTVAAGLARRPRRAARRVGSLGAELGRVASGRSEVQPTKRDRRFADPAWQSSWLFRRLVQTYLAAGETSPEAMIRGVRNGLYITELIGFGVNGVTGDYSRGAVGYWIENGELAYPVEEITVAGDRAPDGVDHCSSR